MPSLVALPTYPDKLPPPYPKRNNRTPLLAPPAIIFRPATVGDGNLLDFRSPTLPPIAAGYPDRLVGNNSRTLDYGENSIAHGDDSDFAGNDDDDDYVAKANPNGLLYSPEEDDDDTFKFDEDLEEYALVDFSDPNKGAKLIKRRRLRTIF